jgi:hypothetical protein
MHCCGKNRLASIRKMDEHLQSIYKVARIIPSPANGARAGLLSGMPDLPEAWQSEVVQVLVRLLNHEVEEPKDRHLTVHKCRPWLHARFEIEGASGGGRGSLGQNVSRLPYVNCKIGGIFVCPSG